MEGPVNSLEIPFPRTESSPPRHWKRRIGDASRPRARTGTWKNIKTSVEARAGSTPGDRLSNVIFEQQGVQGGERRWWCRAAAAWRAAANDNGLRAPRHRGRPHHARVLARRARRRRTRALNTIPWRFRPRTRPSSKAPGSSSCRPPSKWARRALSTRFTSVTSSATHVTHARHGRGRPAALLAPRS